jgi:hypothetical protein
MCSCITFKVSHSRAQIFSCKFGLGARQVYHRVAGKLCFCLNTGRSSEQSNVSVNGWPHIRLGSVRFGVLMVRLNFDRPKHFI